MLVSPHLRIAAATCAVAVSVLLPGPAHAKPPVPTSPQAVEGATRFAAGCPAFDTSQASIKELVGLFHLVRDIRRTDGPVEQGIAAQRSAAVAELRVLRAYCKREGVTFITAVPTSIRKAARTPDFFVRLDRNGTQVTRRVEVVTLTGRKGGYADRARRGERIEELPVTAGHIAAAIRGKIERGQLGSDVAGMPPGGVIAVALPRSGPHPARAARNFAVAVQRLKARFAAAPDVQGLELHLPGAVVVELERDASGAMVVVAPANPTKQQAEVLSAMKAILPHVRRGDAGGRILATPGVVTNDSALTDALSQPGPGGPGGIDFSSLELRYLADTSIRGRRSVRYAFSARPSAQLGAPALGLDVARAASDAFFVWLALPRSSFSVNLNPNEPNRIIDPELARTDAGRVMLESDLGLKKTAVGFLNPDTGLGDRFWDELEAVYGARALRSCVTLRIWIVPAPATVHATADELYILDAPLTVRAESENVPDPAVGNRGCPLEDAATEARKEELVRRVILPRVIEAVNSAPEYAPLRRIYLSRIAAEWYRSRGRKPPAAFAGVVDSGRIDAWVARAKWNPLDVFNAYVTSFRNGEWVTRRETRVGEEVWIRGLGYGGVNLRRIPRRDVTAREFKRRWPHLATRVRRSVRRPVADAERGRIWLGGASGVLGAPRRAATRRRSGARRPSRSVCAPSGARRPATHAAAARRCAVRRGPPSAG